MWELFSAQLWLYRLQFNCIKTHGKCMCMHFWCALLHDNRRLPLATSILSKKSIHKASKTCKVRAKDKPKGSFTCEALLPLLWKVISSEMLSRSVWQVVRRRWVNPQNAALHAGVAWSLYTAKSDMAFNVWADAFLGGQSGHGRTHSLLPPCERVNLAGT